MKTVWEHSFATIDLQTIFMPAGATVLSVGLKRGQPCMWVEVDSARPDEARRFHIYKTGDPMNPGESRKFVGTYQLDGDAVAFHVFEVLEVAKRAA